MGDSDSLQFVASSRSVDPESDPCWSTLEDGYWDPAAFAAEIARLHRFGASTAAVEDGSVVSSDTESETSHFLPAQPLANEFIAFEPLPGRDSKEIFKLHHKN